MKVFGVAQRGGVAFASVLCCLTAMRCEIVFPVHVLILASESTILLFPE